MLPSTGQFKAIACPFFEADQCMRPFCHYKHVRKDHASPTKSSAAAAASVAAAAASCPVPEAVAAPPTIQLLEAPQFVYKPTPKAVLAKEQLRQQQLAAVAATALAAAAVACAEEPSRKRPRLEYVPTLKSVGQNHYGKDRAMPATADATSDDADAVTDDQQPSTATTTPQPAETTASAEPDDVLIKVPPAPKERSSSSHSRSGEHRHRTSSGSDKDRKQLKEHNSTHRSSSTSSSSSSKRSSSRSSSRSSPSHRKPTENSHHRSSSRSSSSSSKHKQHSGSSSSSTKTSSSSSSKSSSSHRRDSKSSTKSLSSSAADTKETTSIAAASSPPPALAAAAAAAAAISPDDAGSDFASDSDEDEVMAQCRLIFDEFQPPAAAAPADTSTPVLHSPPGNGHNGHGADTATAPASAPKSADQMSLDFDEALRRKRTAHDGADAGRPPCAGAPAAHAPRPHPHAAMQTVFKRQEIVRIQLEKMEAKKAAERAASEQRLIDLEAERQARARASLRRSAQQPALGAAAAALGAGSGGRIAHQPASGTPATRPSTTIAAGAGGQPASSAEQSARLAAGPARLAPVASAMQRAKEKIEALRAAKQPTVSRTASKQTGRVAHAAPDANADAKQPPPVLEPQSTKISLNLRMQYYTMMVRHCRTIYAECTDAWERAQAVELGVFNKCNTPVIYKKSATLAINSLRKEALEAEGNATKGPKTVSHETMLNGRKAQNTSWSVNKQTRTPSSAASASTNPLDQLPTAKAYDLIYALRLTDDQLHANGFPRPAERPGYAHIQPTYAKARPNNPNDRYCARCGTVFNLAHFDDDRVVDACNYHAKSPGFLRGSNVNAHRCCQQPSGSPGCMYANHHVSESQLDADRLTGFVRTIARPEEYRPSRADVFALDCEMCYTTAGLELTRVTVVNFERKTVYDALVRPDNKVIDYNTAYSGITAEMLAPERRTLRDVQAVLLSMFHARTVLVGHSLDSDLKALKLIHEVVVDTSVLFPHKLGPPKKRALKMLCMEHLGRIIQESEAGHDSAEDAEVCIQLVRYYLQNQIL